MRKFLLFPRLFGRRFPEPPVPWPIPRILFAIALLSQIAARAPAAFAQAMPAAESAPISTGFALPRVAGTLQYSLTGSESLSWGYYGNSGADTSTNLSGNVAYISSSKTDPFSMIFSGGHSWTTSGEPGYSFLNLAMSQVLNVGRWNVVLSDGVSYLPETPTTGLSGVAGVGDLGLNPVQVGAGSSQGVLTDFSSRVANAAAITVRRQLTGKTSLNATGSYSISRFLDDSGNSTNSGLDSDTESGSGGIVHQISKLTSIGGNYAYSTVNYSGASYGVSEPGFVTQTASGFFSHQFTRKISASVSAGPQWTAIDSGGSSTGLSLFAVASTSYSGHYTSASLSFTRSTNAGFGVVGGALSSGISFVGSRTYARVWKVAVSSAYTQTASLPAAGVSPYSFHTTVGGVQVSRGFARSFSTYVSYTLENQSNSNTAEAVDVFSGLSQVASFGLTYSPASKHFGRQ
jgi:hypothetical protein